MKTVLITGCSSGFGLEIARYFLEHDWQVIATMRTPDHELLPQSDRLRVLPLDITDSASIATAIENAGPIDVLVNNAGIGIFGALEGTPMDAIQKIFETNTLGTMAMTRAVLPQFRQRKAGAIVNVSSSVTLTSLPLASVYTASKAAVNAFTSCLALEMKDFNVSVSVVLPGRAPSTHFRDTAQSRTRGTIPEAYAELAQRVLAAANTSPTTEAIDVAKAVWAKVHAQANQ